MPLPTFVEKTDPKTGAKQTYLNSLRRSVKGCIVVPSQNNGVIMVPKATSSTNPGRSVPTPVEGPQDSESEFHFLTGAQGLSNYGMGTISTVGTAITGVGTKFLTQLTIGSTIVEANATLTINGITDDTHATCAVNGGADVTNVNYVCLTPTVTDVSNRMTCQIRDMAYQRYLMNGPVPVLHLIGDNQKPGQFCESLFMRRNQNLSFEFFNWNTSSPGSMGISIEARKWQREALDNVAVAARIQELLKRKTLVSPYWMTLDVPLPPAQPKVTLAAGGQGDAFMTNTGDQTLFLFTRFGHATSTGAAGDTTEKFAAEFYDGMTGRAYQNTPVTMNTGFGTAQNPYWLEYPIVLHPRNNLRIKLTNLITDQTTDAFMTFGGVAITHTGSAILDRDILNEARKIYEATKPQVYQSEIYR